MQDFRYALRCLARQPVFTLVAILTLTIGIGANTAIFSLLYQVLLRPLPYAEPDRLVFVWNSYPLMGLPKASVSIPDYLDRRTQAPSIEDAALLTQRVLNLAEGDQPEQLRGLAVTPSFFTTLGRQPFLGRAFVEADAQPGADRQVILAHRLWSARFASDTSIVGRTVRLDGEPHEVVGVLPADLELPARDIAALVPFAFTPEQMSDQARGSEFSAMIARLRPGATPAALEAEMKTIVGRNLERLPNLRGFAERSGFRGTAVPIRDELVGDTRAPLYLLQAGVVVVLLIACVNVANLLLMRAAGRQRELAIRTTLGAGRWRLVRQLMTEALVLAGLGAAGGLAAGALALRGLVALGSQQLPEGTTVELHGPVLLFGVALAFLTGLVFGGVPAAAIVRSNTNRLLKEDGTRGSAGRRTSLMRAGLVVAETALALMLLVGAGLLIKSFGRIQDVDPGFEPDHVLTAQLSLPATRYPEPADRGAFWVRLVERVRAIPGVTAAGMTSNVPFNGMVASGSYSIVGFTPPADEAPPHGRQEVVAGEYFRAMQIPLVAGRLFTGADTLESPRVVIVDELLARRYFPGESPLGRQIRRGGPASPPFTIVGVVGTINSIDLGEPVLKERLYYPVPQAAPPAMGLVVKSAVPPDSLVSQVRAAVGAIDPEQPIADVRTMTEWVGRSLEQRRAPMLLLGLFAAVAMALAGIGLYGVLAFGVAERVREFGIRQALGADGRSILSMVLAQGLRTTGAGIAIGIAGSFALNRYLQSLLFGVGSGDPSVYVATTILLLSVAGAAAYVPARRATRIDPMVALRAD